GARARRGARLSGEIHTGKGGGSGGQAMDGVISGVKRMGDRIAVRDPAQVSALRAKLMQAGYFNREAVTVYLGAKSIGMVVATAGTLAVMPYAMHKGGSMSALAIAMVLAVAALLGPDQVIKAKRTKLEREYRDGFPDLLDLLVASVEAGLSLDAAVNRITGELVRRYPNLAEHLRLLTLELRAGRARKDAWTRFAERLGIDEARSFATMLRQAEEMGTSLGDTLTVFSEDMRSRRMLKAEEKALALPAKLVVPLILFIFPCLLGVLMLPAMVKIAHEMAK
ncbi:MAG: type II secretion system F family protein, partial [Caulobacteraceae bacterium]